jgi:hypothetical protein
MDVDGTRARGARRRPTWLVAGAGVAFAILVLAISLAVILRGEGERAPRAVEVPAEPPAPLPPVAVTPEPVGPTPPPAARDPVEVREAHAREAASPMVTRLVPSRGRAMLTRAIETQAPQILECFQPRSAQPAPARPASRRSVVSPDSPGILRLQLEPQVGEIWILDVTVEERGTATDAELACAARALKGRVIEMPGSSPGEPVSMLYPLP